MKRDPSDEDLLNDLQRVAAKLDESPSARQHRVHGNFTPSIYQRRFDTWNDAKKSANLDVNTADVYIPPDELIRDLRRTANRLGTSPSKKQYNEWGEYTATLCRKRFGSWTDAIRASNIDFDIEVEIPEDELLDDIIKVASVVDKTPCVDDYKSHGSYNLRQIFASFDSWVDALTATGYDWVSYEYSDKELLKKVRNTADDRFAPKRSEYYKNSGTSAQFHTRFGGWWAGCVRAGLQPRRRRPLSPKAIDKYHKTALNTEPRWRTYALLFQFTGMPARIVENYSSDWVTARRKRNIIRVPADQTRSGDPWLFEYPETWFNPYTNQHEPTELPETLDWFNSVYDEVPQVTFDEIIKRVVKKGDFKNCRRHIFHSSIGHVPDITRDDLRMTQGVNLAEQGVEGETIKRRLGIEESNWGGNVEDCFLYAYVHRKNYPPNYNPPDVTLDPETGNVRHS